MNSDVLELHQSTAARNSGWTSSVFVTDVDDDGDIEVRLEKAAEDHSPSVYLDADSQRKLRDFLNDQLGDAGGDDTIDAIEGLTDAVYDLSTTLRDPKAVEVTQNTIESPAANVESFIDTITSLLRKDH